MSLKQLLGSFDVRVPVFERELSAKEYVTQDLEADPVVVWIVDGVCKVTLLLEEGKEVTKSLLIPDDAAITPYRLSQDYAVFVQAITPVSIEVSDYLAIREQAESNPLLGRAISRRWADYEAEKEQRFVMDQTLSGMERYHRAVTKLGPWIEKVPLFEIAAYIGITPVQLSRLRKQDSNGLNLSPD